MPCPCPPPKTSHNCPCNSFQFSLNIDSNQNVNPSSASQYDLISIESSSSSITFKVKDGVNPRPGEAFYDYVVIEVDDQRQILPFNVYNNDGKIVIIGPDLRGY